MAGETTASTTILDEIRDFLADFSRNSPKQPQRPRGIAVRRERTTELAFALTKYVTGVNTETMKSCENALLAGTVRLFGLPVLIIDTVGPDVREYATADPHPSGCTEMSDGQPSQSMPYAFHAYRAFSSALYGDVNKFDWEQLWAEMPSNKRRAWTEAAAAVTNLYQSRLDSGSTGAR
jgi:hypothetical protein